MKFDDFAETTAFRQVASTITALSTQDERIAEEFRAIEKGQISSGKIVVIEGPVRVGLKMKLGDFAEAISTRLWKSVGRANWRKFEDARAFVHRLNLKSQAEWFEYSKSGKKPNDIPAIPYRTYLNTGWMTWGDWLGSGAIAPQLRKYRPFKKARAFVRRLSLESQAEWFEYCKSGKRPNDIPVAPQQVYENAGWAGMGDWLGTDAIAAQLRQYQSFKEARRFVHGLGLKSTDEWFAYSKSGKKPNDIPADPHHVYAENGWSHWGDWLGTGRVALGQHRPFKKARAFVRGLGLKSADEWREYCRSGNKRHDIPAAPYLTYAEAGWVGWGDWLGTGRVGNRLRQYRPFNKARAFVRSLGLKSSIEWFAYRKSNKKPADIPTNPNRVYAEAGWSSMGDWLGTGRIADQFREYRPFKKARAFVRRLGLKSSDEWRDYCKSGKKPEDIPAVPKQTYAEDGWTGWGDWLGYARKRQT